MALSHDNVVGDSNSVLLLLGHLSLLEEYNDRLVRKVVTLPRALSRSTLAEASCYRPKITGDLVLA